MARALRQYEKIKILPYAVPGCCNCKGKFHLKCLFDSVEKGHEILLCSICNNASSDSSGPTGQTDGYIKKCDRSQLNKFLKGRGFKIFHQNVDGLLDKVEEVQLLLEETRKDIHILGISETHLNADISDSQASVQDYTFVRKDRAKGTWGGVGCYIRNDIHWQRREDLEQKGTEAMWIEILVKNSKSFLVCIIYRPPDSSKYLDRNFEEKFDDMITTTMAETKKPLLQEI